MPDISFALGLTAEGLVLEMRRSEQAVGAELGKMSGSFDAFANKVEAASNKAKQAWTGAVSSILSGLGPLQAALRGAQKDLAAWDVTGLKAVNAELASLAQSLSKVNAARAQKPKPVAAIDPQSAALLKESRALASLLDSSARNLGLPILSQQLAAIQQQIAALSRQPVTLQTTNALAALSKMQTQLRALASTGAPALSGLFDRGVTLNQEFQKFGGILRNISTVLSTLGLGGGIFALVYGFKRLVAEGISFNAELEHAGISIAASVNATAEMIELEGKQVQGLTAIVALRGVVNQLVDKMRLDALLLEGTFEDLQNVVTGILPSTARLGADMGTVRDLARATGVAASVLGISFQDAVTGVNQLLNGAIVKRNALVKRLPVASFDELKDSLKDANTRAENLLKILNKYAPATALLQGSFKASSSAVQDLVQQLTGITFAPLQKRLQAAFAGAVSSAIRIDDRGGAQFSEAIETRVKRAANIVELLTAQFSRLMAELTQGAGVDTVLDTVERAAPRVLDFFFQAAGAIKVLVSLLTAHGNALLKLLGYYLQFKIVSGVFSSVKNLLLSVHAATQRLSEGTIELVSHLQSATAGTGQMTTATSRLRAVLGPLAQSLKAVATSFAVGLLVVGAYELASGLVESSNRARELNQALSDINNVSFDAAIDEVRKLREEINDGPGFVERLLAGPSAGGQVALDRRPVEQARQIGNAVGVAFVKAAKDAGLNVSSDGEIDPLGKLVRPERLSDLTAQTLIQARDRRLELIGQEQAAQTRGDRAAAERLGEQRAKLDLVADSGRQVFSVVREIGRAYDVTAQKAAGLNSQANKRELEPFKRAADRLRKAQGDVDLAEQRVKITPRRAPQEDEADGKRAKAAQDTALQALREYLQARLRDVDSGARAEKARLDREVADRNLTQQDAARAELALATQTRVEKRRLLEESFRDEIKLTGKQRSPALGVASFAELNATSLTELQKRLADTTAAATRKGSPLDEETVRQFRSLLALKAELERVDDEQATSRERATEELLKAQESSKDFQEQATAATTERRAQAEAELLQAQDLNTALEARLETERKISQAQTAATGADLDAKFVKFENQVNRRTDLTKQEKDALITAEAAAVVRAKEAAALENNLRLLSAMRALREEDLDLQYRLLDTLREEERLQVGLKGEGSARAKELRQLAIQEEARLKRVEAANNRQLSEDANSLGQVNLSRRFTASANLMDAQVRSLEASQTSYLESVADGMGQIAGGLANVSTRAGQMAQDLTRFLQAAATLDRFGGGPSGPLSRLSRVSQFAGPVSEAAGAMISVTTSIFNLFNRGFERILEESRDRVKKAVDSTLGELRSGRATTGSTIESLRSQLAGLEGQFPEQRSTPWYRNLFSPGIVWNYLTGKSNAKLREEMDAARKEIQKEIESLEADAKAAALALVNDLLPNLRVSPEQREFRQELEKLRQEMEELSSLPGIQQADIQEAFALKVRDIRVDVERQLAQEKKNYLGLLKDEQALQQELQDIESQRMSVLSDFDRRRAEILGFVSRQESRSEQIARLKQERDTQLQALDARKADAELRLQLAAQEKALYVEQFGVISDMREYELQVSAELLQRDQARLAALREALNSIQAVASAGLPAFISPASLTPIVNNTSTVSITVGDIVISGTNLDASGVRDAVVEGLRQQAQLNTLRGLAYGDA